MATLTGSSSVPAAPPSGTATGDLTGTYPAPTVAASAITNAKLANMAANSIKINNTGSAAAAIDGTTAQTNTLLGVTTVGTAAVGQVPGTTTNDAAAAGFVGEFISSTILSGAAQPLSTATAVDITSISLTAGDWDVTGNVLTNPNAATTSTLLVGWISLTSATIPTPPNSGSYVQENFAVAAGLGQAMDVGSFRVSVAGPTNVYLSVRSDFAVNSNAAYGYISARRKR